MKKLLLFSCLIFSTALIARTDIDLSSFNKHMIQNMNEVIEDNPEIYETEHPTRKPASVTPVSNEIETLEKLDDIHEQGDAPKSW